jgi:hypothetical protein
MRKFHTQTMKRLSEDQPNRLWGIVGDAVSAYSWLRHSPFASAQLWEMVQLGAALIDERHKNDTHE